MDLIVYRFTCVSRNAVSLLDYGSITNPPSKQRILPSSNTFNFFLCFPDAEIWECLVTEKDVKTGSAPSYSLLSERAAHC